MCADINVFKDLYWYFFLSNDFSFICQCKITVFNVRSCGWVYLIKKNFNNLTNFIVYLSSYWSSCCLHKRITEICIYSCVQSWSLYQYNNNEKSCKVFFSKGRIEKLNSRYKHSKFYQKNLKKLWLLR